MPKANASKTVYSQIESSGHTIRFGFSTKTLGDARKDQTIETLISEEGLRPLSIVRPKQTHGTDILVLDTQPAERWHTVGDYDGLVTTVPGVMLTVVTADCVPIVFYDPRNGVVGVSHQGWKGSLERMAEKMVAAMRDAGADPATMQCYIGPSIGACCYDVPKDRFTTFRDTFFTYYHLFAKKNGETYTLDLAELNVQQLVQAGVSVANIELSGECTSCEHGTFYSYRRDSKDAFGEIVSYVLLD
jgi:YfiH family protein